MKNIMKNYLLNISAGTIHNGKIPCAQAMRMAESNKKWFDKYEDAVNYFEGGKKKRIPLLYLPKRKRVD